MGLSSATLLEVGLERSGTHLVAIVVRRDDENGFRAQRGGATRAIDR